MTRVVKQIDRSRGPKKTKLPAKSKDRDDVEATAPKKRGPKVDVEQTRRRKNDIMVGAARLFDRVGYHGVNMTMIAETVGVKKPTLYHYISSKDQILFDLHELMIGTLQRNTDERVANGADALEILRGVMLDVFKLIHDYPGFVRAFFEHFRELSREQRAEIAVKRDAFIEQITGVTKRAMAKGLINKADPRLTAFCLFGICNWAYQWYQPSRFPPPEELAEQCWQIFLNGLAKR